MNCNIYMYPIRGFRQPPFLRHPSLDPSQLASLFQIFVPLPFPFIFHPLLRYFRQFHPPSCRQPPLAFIGHTNLTHTPTHVHYIDIDIQYIQYIQYAQYIYIYIYTHIYIYTAGFSLLGRMGQFSHLLRIYQNLPSRSNPLPSNLVQKFRENLPPSLKKLVLSYRNLSIGNILTLLWKGHRADLNS